MAIFTAVTVFHIEFNILFSLLGMLTANRVTRELGGRIFEHLFKLPYSQFRKWPVGEMMARISAWTIHKNSSFDNRFYLVKIIDGFTELLSPLDRPF